MAKAEPGWQVIRGGRLADPSRRRAGHVDILIQDGVIRELGENLAAPEGATLVDASGFLLHPGLINAHTHGHGGLGRGQGDRWSLETLLASAPWVGGSRALSDKRLSVLLCAAESATFPETCGSTGGRVAGPCWSTSRRSAHRFLPDALKHSLNGWAWT